MVELFGSLVWIIIVAVVTGVCLGVFDLDVDDPGATIALAVLWPLLLISMIILPLFKKSLRFGKNLSSVFSNEE